jgi:predicted ATPase
MTSLSASVPDNSFLLPVTSFIGHSRELSETRVLLRSNRLVTLTGAGGSGKTRLAAQMARDLATEFRDGFTWCDLSSISEPSYVATNLATRLDLEDPENLVGDLQSCQQLIVLDNCEHLLTACATLAQMLLLACPELKFLTTSLQSLGLPQERVYAVPPLEVRPRHQLQTD